MQRYNAKASAAIDQAATGLFVSGTVYDATGTLPDPAKYTNRIILLSGGTYWLAKSNGTAWIYPNMAPV